jgi:hypothetical protein
MSVATLPMSRTIRLLGVTLAVLAGTAVLEPAPASAGLCGAVGAISGWAGKACSVVAHPDKLIKGAKNLATGHPGKALKAVTSSGAAKGALTLGALVLWVTDGAKSALNNTAGIIKRTTTPQLRSTWFSALYWRMTAIGALLTLPFLFAAAGQAVVRSDLALLTRSALGYLPLSLLIVSIAAPVTMLMLTATDQMSAVVSAAAGQAGSRFLTFTGQHVATLDPVGGSGFLKFFIGLLAAAAAVVLWLEMLMRAAAVYIVVLMLPLAFAAMVWPARRVWAMRIAEMLVALIVAKFVIVAILALGGAALGPAGGTTGLMIGLVLVTLAAFAPWAMLRLIPLAELASGAAGQLRAEMPGALNRSNTITAETAGRPLGWAGDTVGRMRRGADESADDGAGESADDAPSVTRPPHATNGADRNNEASEAGTKTAAAEAKGAVGEAAGTRDDAARPDAQTPSPAPPPGVDAPNGGGDAAFDAAVGAADEPGERLPGLPELYQLPNLGMDTVVLGPEGLPSEPLYREQAALRERLQEATNGADGPADAGTAGNDEDRRPPTQRSDEGLL